MSTPVNLNRFRKAKARIEKSAQADVNAVKFGQSKAQKVADQKAKTKAETRLNQHERDR